MSDNPQFWIQVVRTQANVTDCREKTMALTNAAEAFARIFDVVSTERKRAADCITMLLDDKHELQADLTAAREEVVALQPDAARWRDLMSRLSRAHGCVILDEFPPEGEVEREFYGPELLTAYIDHAINQARAALEAK